MAGQSVHQGRDFSFGFEFEFEFGFGLEEFGIEELRLWFVAHLTGIIDMNDSLAQLFCGFRFY